MQDLPVVELRVRGDEAFVPLVASVAGEAARAFGFGAEAASLQLATEEVFSYLARVAAPGRDVRVELRSGGWFAEATLVFSASALDLSPFNLTFRPAPGSDPGLERTGLLIASRVVDRLRLGRDREGLRLSLRKERSYPPDATSPPPEPRPAGSLFVRSPRPEELRLAARLAAAGAGAGSCPGPSAKLVEMAAHGDLAAAIACDDTGRLAGAAFWTVEGYLAQLHGPFLFQEPAAEGTATSLLDACLSALARTEVRGLVLRHDGHDGHDRNGRSGRSGPRGAGALSLPAGAAEVLGTLPRPGGLQEILFRQLAEDPGATVFVHPSLEAFLGAAYTRLAYPRLVRTVEEDPHAAATGTALSAEVDRIARRARLLPLWWSADAPSIVAGVLSALTADGITGVTFELDLGEPWHAPFAPALLSAGFVPRFVLPWAGTGDVLILSPAEA